MTGDLCGLFITGTDTGVGKTHVAAMIVRELRSDGVRVGAYKPACSGSEPTANGQETWDDLVRLRAAMGTDISDDALCPQRFRAPLAPPIAARQEGRSVDVAAIDAGLERWRGRAEAVVIEGAGGWLCPLTDDRTFADWVAHWRLSVLVVARPTLGTINHTLLTVEAIRHRGLTVAGIVFNAVEPVDAAMADSNAHEVAVRSGAPVWGLVSHGSSGELLRDGRPVRIHWPSLMGPVVSPARDVVTNPW
jgi:dethiobiotin synthetase